MFNSTVLEVAIGLCFTFAAVALITSAANEALASMLKLRASTLLKGIKVLLNDPKFDGFARDIYNHALTNPRSNGEAASEKDLSSVPSYIDARHFAQALIDSLQKADRNFDKLGEQIGRIQNTQMRDLLEGMYQRAEGRLEYFQQEVSNWFDQGMERVGGTYKRQAQLVSFLIALLLAILMNIDAVKLFQALWLHPALVAQLDTANPPTLAALAALPVGWQGVSVSFNLDMLVRIGGWLITASSALFGAPFWFDALQKLTSLRGTGKKA
jgi:hypothetical protein